MTCRKRGGECFCARRGRGNCLFLIVILFLYSLRVVTRWTLNRTLDTRVPDIIKRRRENEMRCKWHVPGIHPHEKKKKKTEVNTWPIHPPTIHRRAAITTSERGSMIRWNDGVRRCPFGGGGGGGGAGEAEGGRGEGGGGGQGEEYKVRKRNSIETRGRGGSRVLQIKKWNNLSYMW